MSQKANTTLIGAFIIGALALAAATLAFIGDGLFGGESEEYVMFFDRTVQGLELGAPMKLRGVKIGEVTSIESIIDADNIINAVYVKARGGNLKYGEIKDPNQLLDSLINEQGMRAQLRIQSLLTGLLYIELDFKGTDSEMKLWGLSSGVRELPTATTEIEELSQIANTFDFDALSKSFRSIMENLDQLVSDPDTQALPGKINESLASITQLSENMDSIVIDDVKDALNQINELAGNVNQDYPVVAADLRRSLASLQTAFGKLERTMADANHLLSDDSPLIYEVLQTLEQMGKAADKINTLAETVEREPESLLKGKSERD